MKRLTLAHLLVLASGLVFGCQGQGGPAPRCSYEASVTLDPAGQSAATQTAITYRNDGPAAIDELVFHLKPAARTAPQFSMNGQPIEAVPWTRDGKAAEDHFSIKLPTPLPAGQSVHLEVKSQAPIQDDHGIKSLSGCWHPKILYRAQGQWLPDIDDFASYRVTVGPVRQPIIPISGAIIERKSRDDGLWTLTSAAEHVPDFAMVFTKADEVVSARQDGVLIQTFYVKDKDLAQRMLKIACEVVAFYRRTYGFYPDNVLNLIAFDGQGFGGGPIGSNIVFVNKMFHLSAANTEWAVAHEIGHEYWGWNQVIDANPRVGWLCLGMGLWTDRQYVTSKGIDGQNGNILNEYVEAAKGGMNTRLERVTPLDRWNRMNENPLAHGKGYCIAQMLEYVCGKEAMRKIAKAALAQHAHGPIGLADFQRICQTVTGRKLDWFFRPWTQTNDVLDYAVAGVKAEGAGDHRKITVTVSPKGIVMPLDVMVEFADGSKNVQRISEDRRECVFDANQDWRRVILDPEMALPDLNRKDNVKANADVPPAFEVLQIDMGDKAWGLNLLKVHVKNTLNAERPIFIHIGCSGKQGQLGFGEGALYKVAANGETWIEHWYWIPPRHGQGTIKVSITDPVTTEPQYEEPFFTKSEELVFAVPNHNCNNLTITDKLPRDRYKGMRHLDAFRVFPSEHFVFYCSPNTPAFGDIEKIIASRESALKAICDFAGAVPNEKIIVFLYPDPLTKFMCTMHQGDGMARGSTIAEVYNEKVKLDPSHEIAHIVMRGVGDPPAMFNEGFAVHSQKDRAWKGRKVDDTARDLLKVDQLTPVTALLAREEIGARDDDGQVAYPESASFVGFLIDDFGREKLLAAYRKLKNGGDKKNAEANLRAIKEVFGEDLTELESGWRRHLIVQPASQSAGEAGNGMEPARPRK